MRSCNNPSQNIWFFCLQVSLRHDIGKEMEKVTQATGAALLWPMRWSYLSNSCTTLTIDIYLLTDKAIYLNYQRCSFFSVNTFWTRKTTHFRHFRSVLHNAQEISFQFWPTERWDILKQDCKISTLNYQRCSFFSVNTFWTRKTTHFRHFRSVLHNAQEISFQFWPTERWDILKQDCKISTLN